MAHNPQSHQPPKPSLKIYSIAEMDQLMHQSDQRRPDDYHRVGGLLLPVHYDQGIPERERS